MTTPSDSRLAYLRSYFRQLAVDMAAEGKFRAAGSDKIEAAAVAVLGGTGSMAAQLWQDVRALGGEGAALAQSTVKPMVENLIASTVQRGVNAGIEKAASGIASMFSKPKQTKKPTAEQKAAEDFMNAAKRLGSR